MILIYTIFCQSVGSIWMQHVHQVKYVQTPMRYVWRERVNAHRSSILNLVDVVSIISHTSLHTNTLKCLLICFVIIMQPMFAMFTSRCKFISSINKLLCSFTELTFVLHFV